MPERPATPPGYTRVIRRGIEAVALASVARVIEQLLAEGTLYQYAEHHPEARMLVGRGIVYAVPLPDGGPSVVVRHARHGGLLAPLTGDRFLGRTRAPRELDVALRLARVGVPTPEIVAYAIYPAGVSTYRADVVTREVHDARDLASALADDPAPALKRDLLAATAKLLARLAAAGARHPDLNLKNVLIARDANGDPEAWVLDVDRVWFDVPGAPRVNEANLRRVGRSARKLRRTRGLDIQEADLLWLSATVDETVGARA